MIIKIYFEATKLQAFIRFSFPTALTPTFSSPLLKIMFLICYSRKCPKNVFI